jgi:hypothetical protein
LSAQAAPNSEVHTAYLQSFKVWCSKLQVPYDWNLNLISWHDINHVSDFHWKYPWAIYSKVLCNEIVTYN